jgi:hypothetical protein
MTRPNPYIGPRPFRTGEKIHGRERELRELMDLLIAERIVLLHSPSGAGKSSLIYAGLIPGLTSEGFHVLPVARVNVDGFSASQDTPGSAHETPNALANRYILSLILSLEGAAPPEQRLPAEELAGLGLDEYINRICLPPVDASSIVLIIDQFEEILTQNPTDIQVKHEFFTQLGSTLRDRRLWVLFAMREDYLAGLNPFVRPIPTRLSNTYRLDFLGVEAAYQAVQNPAIESGVAYAEEAACKLIDDLRRMQVQQPDGSIEKQAGLYVEPVQLQVVCYRLWDHLEPDDDWISIEDIAEIGNVDDSLAEYYAERVQLTAQQTGVSERVIREWVEQHLITDQGLRGSVQMGVESSKGLSNAAIRLLENGHLLRAEKRAGATWFELTHDRLIHPIRRDNTAWLLAHLNLLQRQARLWSVEHRPESLLLRGNDLEEAQAWAAAHEEELNVTEEQYLEASLKLAEQERTTRQLEEQEVKLEAAQKVAESEKKRAEERAIAAERLRRRAFYLTTALAAVLFATILAVSFANQAIKNANEAALNADRAHTQQALAELSKLEAEQNAFTAEQNAIMAEKNALMAEENAREAEAERANALANLAHAQTQQAVAEAASTQAISQQSTASAANQQVLVIAQQAIAQNDDEETREQVGPSVSRSLASIALNLINDEPQISLMLGVEAYRAADSPEARYALLAGIQSHNKTGIAESLWTIQDDFSAIVFSPDGQRIAIGTTTGEVKVYEAIQGATLITRQNMSQAPVTALAFSPDGGWLAVGDRSGRIEMMPLERRQNSFLYIPDQAVTSLHFRGDSAVLASGGNSDAVYFWDNFQQLAPPFLDPPSGIMVTSLAWKPQYEDAPGDVLAAGMRDGSIWIWQVAARTGSLLVEAGGAKIDRLAWSPTGGMLAAVTGVKDPVASLRVWDTDTGELRPISGSTDGILAVAFDDTGRWMAASTQAETLILWNPVENQTIGPPLPVIDGSAIRLIFADDTGFLYGVSQNGAVQRWDLQPERWVDLICRTANQNLTRTQWSFYFPNQDYRKTCPDLP